MIRLACSANVSFWSYFHTYSISLHCIHFCLSSVFIRLTLDDNYSDITVPYDLHNRRADAMWFKFYLRLTAETQYQSNQSISCDLQTGQEFPGHFAAIHFKDTVWATRFYSMKKQWPKTSLMSIPCSWRINNDLKSYFRHWQFYGNSSWFNCHRWKGAIYAMKSTFQFW